MVNGIYVIDMHTHIFPEKIAMKAAVNIGNFYTQKPYDDGTVETLLKTQKDTGVDYYIVSSVATTPKQVRAITSFITDIKDRMPDRISGFGAMHPLSDDLRSEIREIKDCGLIGIKLHPDIQGFRVDDPRCMKIFELCEEYQLPVLVHAGDKRYDNSNPDRLKPVIEAFPELTFIAAHLGGWSVYEEATNELAGLPNLYVDVSSSINYISTDMAERLIRAYGTDRVLFGSDYPLWNVRDAMRQFLALDLTETEQKQIFHENTAKLFGLEDKLKL